MPPKKKGPVTTLKEINPQDYARNVFHLFRVCLGTSLFLISFVFLLWFQAIRFPPLGDTPQLASPLKGTILNVETLFPEWNIDGESWGDVGPSDSVNEGKIPSFMKVVSTVPLKEYLKLESAEDKDADTGKKGKGAAPKKEVKKGKKEVSTEFVDLAVDETGMQLPRVFIGTTTTNDQGEILSDESQALEGFSFVYPFQREIAMNNNAGDRMAFLGVDAPVAAEDITGEEIDPYMCAAFAMVNRFAAALNPSTSTTSLQSSPPSPSPLSPSPSSTPSTQTLSNFPYLWRSIYPQSSSGRPCFNSAGKYCVKLYLGGAWRKVVVLDSVPVRADGRCVLASSSQALELWPLLLSKAIYAAFCTCG